MSILTAGFNDVSVTDSFQVVGKEVRFEIVYGQGYSFGKEVGAEVRDEAFKLVLAFASGEHDKEKQFDEKSVRGDLVIDREQDVEVYPLGLMASNMAVASRMP